MLVLGLLIITHLILPLIFLIWLWRGKDSSKLDWLIKLFVVTLYSLHIFLSGRWDVLSYYIRFVLVVLVAAAAILSFVKVKSLALYPPRKLNNYLTLGVNSAVAVFLLVILSSYVPQGYAFMGTAIQLSFPLKAGTYYVGQGGNSSAINYHNANPAQRYALDIVKLNAFGARTNGFQMQSLANYDIFGESLYSPCNGTVKSTVNTLPDLSLQESDSPEERLRQRKNPAGNHILINCKSADVILAHLQQGSITVQAGNAVKVGQAIAKVGNSGNTSEPHLHIHARKENAGRSVLDGEGIPITFDNRFLARNSLFSVN